MQKLTILFLSLLLAGMVGNAGYAQTKITGKKKTPTAKYSPAIFTSLFDGKTLNGWTAVPTDGWTVADSAIAMTGNARGFIYTNSRYTSYRIIFSVRQIKGKDHWPCQLIFGADPQLDALGAVQFQLPKDWTWDYRPGKNNSGKGYFSWPTVIPNFNKTDWARCEILVDAATGSARTAVAQPIGSQAVAFTTFKDVNIPNIPAPFGLQSHNKGQFDEYKEIIIEANPKVDELLTILPAPTGLKVTRKQAAKINLNWSDNSNAEDGFIIQKSTDNVHWMMLAKVAANVTGYSDRKLRRNTRYYYRVSAFNAAVVSPYASADSENKTVEQVNRTTRRRQPN